MHCEDNIPVGIFIFTFTFTKFTIEALEQGVKYVES